MTGLINDLAGKQAIIPPGTYALVPTWGTLAARPASPVKGDAYLATDTAGGTLYAALAAGAWTQVAAGVTSSSANALLAANNLADVGDPALARQNLAAAPIASPTFTGV